LFVAERGLEVMVLTPIPINGPQRLTVFGAAELVLEVKRKDNPARKWILVAFQAI
jgi:hypothetical protein